MKIDTMPMVNLSMKIRNFLQHKNPNRMGLKMIEDDNKIKSDQDYRKKLNIIPYDINLVV